MLIFSAMHLKNWRNFGNVRLSIENRLFVIGANAAGKSNLLDVFRFLKDVANDGLQKAVINRGGIKKLRNLNARAPSYIEIDIWLKNPADGSSWEYKLQFNAAAGRNDKRDINISLEYISHDTEEVLNRKYSDASEDYTTRQFTHLEQPSSNGCFRDLYDAFRTISYVNIIPQLIRESEAFIPSKANEDFFGRNLLETIAATSVKQRDFRLRSISKVLGLAVPQFSELKFVQDEKGRPHLQVRYEHFRPSGAYQWEDQFSDGTLRLIGILWAILDGDSLLLLEEPELYLHTEIVRQLPEFIARTQRVKKIQIRQILISSHSFDLLNSNTIDPQEVIILLPGKESTEVVPASDLKDVNDMISAGYTVAEAVIPKTAPKSILDGQLTFLDIG